MTQHIGKARETRPRLRGVGLAATLALTAAGSAHAFEIKTENPDIEARWDCSSGTWSAPWS